MGKCTTSSEIFCITSFDKDIHEIDTTHLQNMQNVLHDLSLSISYLYVCGSMIEDRYTGSMSGRFEMAMPNYINRLELNEGKECDSPLHSSGNIPEFLTNLAEELEVLEGIYIGHAINWSQLLNRLINGPPIVCAKVKYSDIKVVEMLDFISKTIRTLPEDNNSVDSFAPFTKKSMELYLDMYKVNLRDIQKKAVVLEELRIALSVDYLHSEGKWHCLCPLLHEQIHARLGNNKD